MNRAGQAARLLAVLSLITLVAHVAQGESRSQGPLYGSPQTRSTIEGMIAAHGGMERWSRAPTVSFLRRAEVAGDPRPWVLHETIEQGRRRIYQDWPEDRARLVSDGSEVWTVNWNKIYPPAFVAQIGFYFMNMPWITQDSGVVLLQIEPGSHPNSNNVYTRVEMGFRDGTGETSEDRYVLFIDPQSDVLRAIEYHVTYGALLDRSFLPPKVKSIGPFFHVNHEFADVDGLKVPVRYSVFTEAGDTALFGTLHDWSFTKRFDESRLEKPPEAVVDLSSATRKSH